VLRIEERVAPNRDRRIGFGDLAELLIAAPMSFTTGAIGPTHGDITADCVAKAFGVPIDTDPRALAILHEWVKATGAEMSETRLRMTRIPKGADLILNKVSGAPGFWIQRSHAFGNRARGCARGRHRRAAR
jgi:molybdopterin-biosynthesis enzyme MoeA-like protein